MLSFLSFFLSLKEKQCSLHVVAMVWMEFEMAHQKPSGYTPAGAESPILAQI